MGGPEGKCLLKFCILCPSLPNPSPNPALGWKWPWDSESTLSRVEQLHRPEREKLQTFCVVSFSLNLEHYSVGSISLKSQK